MEGTVMQDFAVGDHVNYPLSSFVWDKGPNIDGRWEPKLRPDGSQMIGCGKIIEATNEYVVVESGGWRFNHRRPIDAANLWKSEEHGPR